MTTNSSGVNAASEPAQTLQPGQKVLGRYTLNRILGQGGMGVVWLAHDDELERDVALKFLPNVVVNDGASLAELKRETKRSLELTHPHIVRTYDFVQDSTIAGISMEFVDADTLRNRRVAQPKGFFEPADIGDWTRQLCEALDYAHRQAHIVHRDLKPANLMVNGRNQLKVADFGISRSLVETVTQVTGMRGISGTLVYMSPQQLGGETPAPTDDIYALGATLYELCTTRPPFYSGDVSGQIYNKTAPSMAERRRAFGLPIGEIPAPWEDAIAACLSKESADRPQTAAELAARLGLVTAGTIPAPMPRPITATVPPPVRQSGPPPPTASYTTSPTFSAGPAAAPNTDTFAAPITASFAPGTVPPVTTQTPQMSKRMWGAVWLGAVALLVGALFFVGIVTWLYVASQSKKTPKTTASQPARPSPTGDRSVPVPNAPLEPVGDGPVNARGSMVVNTDPANAQVIIDGSPAKATPAVISDLKTGPHTVEITRDGYNPVQQQVEIKENQPLDLGTISLVRSVGGLKIETDPAGLKYTLRSDTDQADNRVGETPLSTANIPTGSYQVIVERDGWKPASKAVTIVRGQEQRLSFEFPTGSVSITSIPSGAKVFVNNEVVGLTPVQLENRPPGELKYIVSASGYEKFEGAVVVQEGQTISAPVVSLSKNAPAVIAKKSEKTEKSEKPAPTPATAKRSSSSKSSSSRDRDSDSRSSNRRDDGPSGAQRAADIMRNIPMPGRLPFR